MRRLAAFALVVALAACDPLGGYHGPAPSEAAITDEAAVVRLARALPDGSASLALDRLRYVERDPASIDRAVLGRLDSAQVAALPAFAAGDTVRFSSEFWFLSEGGIDGVPDWPINGYWEPLVATHRVREIRRVAGP